MSEFRQRHDIGGHDATNQPILAGRSRQIARHGACKNREMKRRQVRPATNKEFAMTRELTDFDPHRLAAVVYRPENDVDALLAEFAGDLLATSARIGGVVQRNSKNDQGKLVGMRLVDLMTGREIGIYQKLGSGSVACKLDASGLAEATRSVTNAIAGEVSLIIVNKFSKQEASGGGLRAELADAIIAGLPVLIGLPEKSFAAWKTFTGDRGTTLLCARRVIDAWWQEVSDRETMLRRLPPLLRGADAAGSEITFRS
jgi:molybdate transport system ATP-binding protein